MTLMGLLFRFTLAYFAVLLVVGPALHMVGSVPAWLSAGLRAGIFAGAAYSLLSLFSLRNNRAATKVELGLGLLGMLTVDFLVNALGRSSGVDPSISVLAALTVSAIHGLFAVPAVISVHRRMTRLFLRTSD